MGGTTCRNSTVSSDSHLQIGHQWFDQCHLGGFGPFVPIALRSFPRTVAACVVGTVWSSCS